LDAHDPRVERGSDRLRDGRRLEQQRGGRECHRRNPRRAAIDERWAADVDYFADIATELLNGRSRGGAGNGRTAAWALMAGRLGNRENCRRFADDFWYGNAKDRESGDAAEERRPLLRKTLLS
jgi:hypothetical protein